MWYSGHPITAPRWMTRPVSNQARMVVHTKRQVLALVSYLMFLLPLTYGVANQWVNFTATELVIFSFVAIGLNGVFWWLIRSGFSRRFKDPGMTMAQVVVSIGLSLFVIRHAEQARPVMLLLFVTCFFFGVFGLGRRQFWGLAIGTIIAYAVVVGSAFIDYPKYSERFKLEVLQFIALSMILCWMATLGGYVSNLRKTLSMKSSALSQALGKLQYLVNHDELTGVYNRRRLMERIEEERVRANEGMSEFSVCLIDIDHFKAINDTHGHQAGDIVLKEFAKRLLDQAAPTLIDQNAPASRLFFGRYGGEEFMVSIPGGPDAAVLGMQRLSALIQDKAIDVDGTLVHVQFSAGVAGYRPGESIESVIARADSALYQAKAAGRNRTFKAS